MHRLPPRVAADAHIASPIAPRASRRPLCAGPHGLCCRAGWCRPCRGADAAGLEYRPTLPRQGPREPLSAEARASAARRVPLKRRPPPSSAPVRRHRLALASHSTRRSDTAERILEADRAQASEGEGALELVLLGQIDPLVLPAAAVEGPRLHALELEREPRPHLLQPRLAAALVLGEYVPADASRLTRSRSACAPKFPRNSRKRTPSCLDKN